MSDTSISAPLRPSRWLRRRALLVPTWRTWLLFFGSVILLAMTAIKGLHGWLAVSNPVTDARYLVVEGWAPDYVIQAASDYAEEHGCLLVITSGVPLDAGAFLSEYNNYAFVAAATLEKLGFDKSHIRPAPSDAVKTDRTRAMALKVREVLTAENIKPLDKKINLFTLGTHGRRSQLIYRSVLGADWQVGVISVPSRAYEESTWYRQSSGAKTVIDELVALAMQKNTPEGEQP